MHRFTGTGSWRPEPMLSSRNPSITGSSWPPSSEPWEKRRRGPRYSAFLQFRFKPLDDLTPRVPGHGQPNPQGMRKGILFQEINEKADKAPLLQRTMLGSQKGQGHRSNSSALG